MREALLFARLAGGPKALAARDALRLGTRNGAHCLGRSHVLGHLAVDALADIVLWDVSGLVHDNVEDPVTALVYGPPRRAHTVLVGGEAIVEEGRLTRVDEDAVTRELARETARLADRVAAPQGAGA